MLYYLANSSYKDHFCQETVAVQDRILVIDHHEPNIKTLYSFSTGASIEWRLFQIINLNWMLAPIQPREGMNIS